MTEPGFETRGFTLFDWQRAAVDAWAAGPEPFRGTLAMFTGGGKSLVALACAREAAVAVARTGGGAFRLLVVVPTTALADQWVETIAASTNVPRARIGRLTAAGAATAFERWTAVVAVINTAAKLAKSGVFALSDETLLIVDECHRAGAPSFRAALDLGRRFRLGLSATPERDELGDDGEPLVFDDQIVAKKLGGVVYAFGLDDARRAGRLPDYEIRHHGIALLPGERTAYEAQSGEVDDLARRLRAAGVEPGRARALLGAAGATGTLARAYLAKTAMRKDLLYRAAERERVALLLAAEAMEEPGARILLFNERIEAVEALAERLRSAYGTTVAVEHSHLPAHARRTALAHFRAGDARLLVSAKSLIEGIDVPEATVGISVASTASVRQRVQALGRVLRKGADGKRAAMHLLYVRDTVDESIYEKEDWSDLTGASRNVYLRWTTDPHVAPERLDAPPKKPRPTEDQMAQALERSGATFPAAWPGAVSGPEYRVDTRGTVRNALGTAIADGLGAGDMIRAARGAPGGRFRVTPKHRFVLVFCRDANGAAWKVAGRLAEPFEARDAPPVLARDERNDEPGTPYRGPANRTHGEFKARARGGGMIERKRGAPDDATGTTDEARTANAARVLAAWRRVAPHGITFYVNDEWDAWYERDGVPTFLAHVPGGLPVLLR